MLELQPTQGPPCIDISGINLRNDLTWRPALIP